MHAKTKPVKKPTNISMPAEFHAEAKRLGINISQICERSLREAVHMENERRWNSENAEFIAAYNASVERERLALEQWRAF